MREYAFRAFARVLLGVCLLTLAACGGGGGGGGGSDGTEEPPPLSLLSGNFGLTGFRGRASGGLSHETRWGAMGSDGAGSFSSAFDYNADTATGSTTQDHFYTIGVGRRLGFANEFGEYAIGRVAESGRLAALSWLVPGRIPGLLLNLQRGLNQTNADLTGTYRGCFIGFTTGVNKPEGGAGTYTFGGDGTWTGTWNANIDGLIIGPQTPAPGTYDVSEPGAVRWVYGNGFTLRGQLLRGGAVLSVAGGTVDGDQLYWHCFVKQASGLDTSALSGTYALIGIEYDFDVGTLDWIGVGGTWTGNGAGGYTATFQENEATSISSPVTETGTYAVGADGRLTVTTSDGEVYLGGLSGDRVFAVYGGGISEGSKPGIYLLVR